MRRRNFGFLSFLKGIFFLGVSQEVQSSRLDSSAISSSSFPLINIPLIEQKNQQHRIRSQIASNMMRSSGVMVARTYIYDWLILMALVVIGSLLLLIHPFHRFVGKDMMTSLKYPLKGNTVPFWTVPTYALLLPMVIFVVLYLRRRDIYDLHHAVLGLLYSASATAVITNALKLAVGRPRPDFFWRCFPDGKDVYDRLGNVICHGKRSVIDEGHKSFPSGHTSWSFAGLGFLSLYLAGKIKAFDRKGHVAKLCIICLPLLVASLVGISRVDDYWHHWQDVFTGGLLGLTVAGFCYLQFFPPPYHAQGWGPYAYFEELELRRNAQAANAADMPDAQAAETQNESCLDERSGIGCISPTAGRSRQDMEPGEGDSVGLLSSLICGAYCTEQIFGICCYFFMFVGECSVL
ncbi:lipid phosphate phosphatase 2-like isoform X1 [Rhodamnia argentea]|uniref:Lipid phosphate phosphatase 2-like isoform X1 n=1 Tax=Rhodamnia argentea TaxID=178133 RepID=A0ABM3HV42_9MYRT|nr:lipid phosphate phosphatase 2-like isoform X1 [Rhodamnia argentea]